MPILSILSNSALATASFSPARRRGLAKTGGPVVGTTCSTPWRGGLLSYFDTRMSGKESRSASISLHRGLCRPHTETVEQREAGMESKGERRWGRRTSCLFWTSTRRPVRAKKSDPSIGRETSARRKEWARAKDGNFSLIDFVP